ncbi:hypothetical protein FB45DRAFT_1034672 [Roridomyces roridus]|uniref:Uncharacterized protein n=1 Tax=Roridomyces roridus TaxID=1738132 RepID=A0AAD7FFM5_9AGAR|nr:hypothetical protein FB45DRAFT_1034672 [Roridomyces roridus]
MMRTGAKRRWNAQRFKATTESKKLADAFDAFLAFAGEDVEAVVKNFFKSPQHWERLLNRMSDFGPAGRQQDTKELKPQINEYFPSDTAVDLKPSVRSTGDKKDCGFLHPMIRDALSSWPLRLKINEMEDGPGEVKKPTAAADKALKDLDQTHNYNTEGYPSCFYAVGGYDGVNQLDEKEGLLQVPIVLWVLRHIWFAKGKAMSTSTNIPPKCSARSMGVKKITAPIIVYTAIQTIVMLSSYDWDKVDNLEGMFDDLMELFEDDKEWGARTIAWYQERVFGVDEDDNSTTNASKPKRVTNAARMRAAREAAPAQQQEAGPSQPSPPVQQLQIPLQFLQGLNELPRPSSPLAEDLD